MVAALWSNSNWDDDKGTRKKAIDDLGNSFDEAVEAVEKALSAVTVTEEEKLSRDNPFFEATERGLSQVEEKVSRVTKDGDKEKVDYMEGLDQE